MEPSGAFPRLKLTEEGELITTTYIKSESTILSIKLQNKVLACFANTLSKHKREKEAIIY